MILAFAGSALEAGLNDTGQTLCYDSAGNGIVGCVGAADDGRYGRDAAATAGVLTKTGAGAAGFDFTKIANDGSTLAVGAALGSLATDWACTRDNTTGLDWEIKTDDGGLRDKDWTYDWYSTNFSTNGGYVGDTGGNTCNGTLPSSLCNTQAYVTAVNALNGGLGLCNHNDWRMPTLRELRSIVHYGTSDPAIDTDYFPNTPASIFWSASTYVPFPLEAWTVNFYNGFDIDAGKTSPNYVRLVRGETPPALPACAYTVSPTTRTISGGAVCAAASASISVTATLGCAWTAAVDTGTGPAWITIVSGGGPRFGTGAPQTMTYHNASNYHGDARSGTIAILDAGSAPTSAVFTLTHASGHSCP